MPTVPDIHRRGTRAAQATLAAPPLTVGTLYFVTDEGVTERWNGTAWESYSGAGGSGSGGPPAAHHTTHETGGSDAVVALAGSVITSGTLPDARLSTNVQMKPIAATDLPAHATRHQPGGADPLAVDAAAATGSLRTLGTGAQQAAPGNDARFAAPSIPTAHAPTHSAGNSDPVTVTALAGYPGGTTTFLRADGTFAAPTTGVPAAHHATHETGGTDALTALSAAILTSGTLPDARLSANVPLLNAPNAFTAAQTMTPPLGVASGGTGAATLAAHSVLVGAGTTPVAVIAPGTTGQVLTSRGATLDPTFQTVFADVVQDFRLTLTFGAPVGNDASGASTIVFSPYVGRRCTVFDASGNATTLVSGEISLAVPAVANQMYDVFVYNNGGVLALEFLAWTNDTTRAVAVARGGSNDAIGVIIKSTDATRRYVGTFRTKAAGNVDDYPLARSLWNYYWRMRRPLLRQETTVSWTYTTATLRQANNSAANQVDVVIGIPEVTVDLTVAAIANNSVGGMHVVVGIGEDSTTIVAPTSIGQVFIIPPSIFVNPTARLTRQPTAGHHAYTWLEFSDATGATTWYGTGVAGAGSSGLTGWVEA